MSRVRKPFNPHPVGLPAGATLGMDQRTYATSNRDDGAKREGDFTDDGVAADGRLMSAAHVAHLEIWRRAGTPPMVTVNLGANAGLRRCQTSPRLPPEAGDLRGLSV